VYYTCCVDKHVWWQYFAVTKVFEIECSECSLKTEFRECLTVKFECEMKPLYLCFETVGRDAVILKHNIKGKRTIFRFSLFSSVTEEQLMGPFMHVSCDCGTEGPIDGTCYCARLSLDYISARMV
jgi:hypothetical protein